MKVQGVVVGMVMLVGVPAGAWADRAAEVRVSSSGRADSGAPLCVDETPVVGRAECTRYAAWDVARVPRLQMSFGAAFHVLPMGQTSLGGPGPGVVYKAEAGGDLGSSGTISAWTMGLRVTGNLTRHLYVGGEGNAGEASFHDGGLTVGDGVYVMGGAVGGIVVPLHHLAIRGEALAGRRAISAPPRMGVDRDDGRYADWVIAPRLAVQVWLGPWTTVGVFAGTNVLGDDDLSAGLFLQGHARAFDGTRAR